MTEGAYTRMLDEIDRLLNDPDVQLEPARVWALLAEVAQRAPPTVEMPFTQAQ